MVSNFGFRVFLFFFLYFATVFKPSHAWSKSHFTIDSSLPKKCGQFKEYSPKNHVESWGVWPWLGVAYYNGSGIGVKCNAILIHPQAVLTSLKCFKNELDIKTEEHIFVAFSLPDLPTFQNISVTDIDFIGETYYTTLSMAILKLSEPVKISEQVHPICLWEEDYDYSGQLKSYIGLVIGADRKDLKSDDMKVRQAPVRILSSAECNETHSDLFGNSSILEPICINYYKVPENCHGLGSMMILPRLSESSKIVWYLRSIITSRKSNCDDEHNTITFDIGSSRKWLDSHFNSE